MCGLLNRIRTTAVSDLAQSLVKTPIPSGVTTPPVGVTHQRLFSVDEVRAKLGAGD